MLKNKILPLFKLQIVSYAFTALLLFTVCFFVHFGREAHSSKSWEYVLPGGEDLVYWSYGKGRIMTPRCDGNPFYFEEQGTRHIIPWTTAETIGLISKYAKIPFSWFFPAWHILAPFLTWLLIVLCCWKLWDYPLSASAAITYFLLFSTLFHSHQMIQWTLYRFSRPLDGIALLFLWISLVFKGNRNNKIHFCASWLVPPIVLWLHPYYAGFGLWFTVIEYVRGLLKNKNASKFDLRFWMTVSTFIAGFSFIGYAFSGENINPLVLFGPTKPSFGSPFLNLLTSFLWLAVVWGTVLFFKFSFREKTTPLDFLTVESAIFLVWVCWINGFVVPKTELIVHLHYFLVPMIFSMTGWVYEKVIIFKKSGYFSIFSKALVFLTILVLTLSLVIKENLIFCSPPYFSIKILQYFFIILVSVWAVTGFDFLRRLTTKKGLVYGLIIAVAVAGHWIIPLNPQNRDFPFAGAFQWLKKNAQEKEVVLTASRKYRFCDYLFLKTGLKSYYNDYGSGNVFIESPQAKFRVVFYTALLLNRVDKIRHLEALSLEEKIHLVRLDYVLIPIPSPFYNVVTRQLQGFLKLVYQDKKCFLWKVT
ncbi:MAG TPA: hypothetical protein PLO78_03195 [Candidatus Omnitrophota bacterium]|nr:hypothetical protein [Candidatus Omnitrophota bacterium]